MRRLRHQQARVVVVALVVLAVLAMSLSLAACAPATGGWTEGGAEAGYVSGDRSVTTWDAADRSDPVELAGTDFAGAAVDVADWRGDVVVLNTCCIRENADNKLYGTLGHLKSVKDRRPGMEIVVGGCLAQK